MAMDYQVSRGDRNEVASSGASSKMAASPGRPDAVILAPGENNLVVLPEGASLDDIHIHGRDLVVELPDGRVYIIPDGAVFVPVIVIDGVAVPPLNLAAYLNSETPQPAAGTVQSSGGNFADPAGPIQAAFGLGDLLPYTELLFPEPQDEEIIPGLVDREPTILIVTPDQPAGARNATASVNEAGLPARGGEPAGSNSAANSETTTGSIVFDAPDGLASISINGVLITQVGQTISTPQGTLTITSIAAGSLGYSYVLADNTSGDNTFNDFLVTVTDVDGDAATASLRIGIVDDIPTARNDTDTLPANTFTPATGNVITAVGTTSAPGSADTVGADAAAVTRIASNNVSANVDTTFDGSGNLVVAGQYGTLSIRADGSYSYQRAPNTPGGVNDVFTYTLTDGDGDASNATLTIAIGDSTPGITNLTPQAEGGDAIVDEDDLPNGSDTSKESTTGTGTFTINSPDGVGSLVIDGHTVITNGVFAGQSWTTALGNTLTVTAFDSATGVVSYGYTLTAAETHAAGAGENSLFESFGIALTDLDGDPASGTLSVRIIDDIPSLTVTENREAAAVLDETSVASTAPQLGVSAIGDDPDVSGSGRIAVATSNGPVVTLGGAFGADGPAAVNPLTYALDVTNIVSGLSVTDGSAISLVNEGGVIVGRVQGGTFADQAAFAIIVDGNGQITVEQYLSLQHSINPDPNDSVSLGEGSLGIIVSRTDADGDSISLTVDISDRVAFRDDGPIAANDVDSVTEGLGNKADGNVFTGAGGTDANLTDGVADTIGADGAAAGGAVTGARVGTELAGGALTAVTAAGVTISGTYGDLLIKSDGSYVYTLKTASIPAGVTSETFTYQITDGDGDTDLAQLAITLNQDARVPNVAGDTGTVYEDGLADGVQHGASSETDTTGQFVVNANGEGYTLMLDGDAGGPVTITAVGQQVVTSKGVLEITSISAAAPNGDVTYGYSYTLSAALTHSGQGEVNPLSDTITMSVTDATGDSDATPGSIVISIVDDIPVAAVTNGPESLSLINTSGASASGSFSMVFGADGAGAQGFNITAPTVPGVVFTETDVFVGGVFVRTELLAEVGTTHTAGTGDDFFKFTVFANGTYQFDLINATQTTSEFLSFANLSSGGPGFRELEDDPLTPVNENGRVEFESNGSGVNASGAGFGVSNQFVDVGEWFKMQFKNPGVTGDNLPQSNQELLDKITFSAADVKFGPVDFAWTATRYNADGTVAATESGVVSIASPGLLTFDPTIQFSEIRIENIDSDSKATVRFDTNLTIYKSVLPPDVTYNFNVVAVDGDGDTTATIPVSVFVDEPATPPIVLDLDGDGAEFLSRAAGVAFQYNPAGLAINTAWVGKDDGLLVFDHNGDRVANDGSEIVFGGNGLTDLQGLALTHDSNHDGVLDASDVDFAKFGVWQDVDSDGVTDAGEFHTLSELGITQIRLVSDGVSYDAANGDVTVHGTSSYTTADGTTRAVADASFTTEAERMAARTAEITSTAVAAGALLAATSATAEPVPDDTSAPAPVVVQEETAVAAPSDTPVSDQPTDTGATTDYLASGSQDAPAPTESQTSTHDADSSGNTPSLSEAHDYSADGGLNGGDAGSVNDGGDQVASQGSLFDGAASFGDAELMNMLLAAAPQGQQAAAQPATGAPVVQEVLADAGQTQFVDHLVESLGSSVAQVASSEGHDPAVLMNLLSTPVSSGHDFAVIPVDFGPTAEEAHALAAA
ncbi:MAG TPA: DUF5801 repeats-in-toxin domain-containing protein [Novosphingobium sp.]